MRIEDFEDSLDRLGGDLDSWSKEDAAAARTLLGNSEEARRLLGEARLLRRAFTADAPVRAPSGLADRIVREALASSPARQPVAREPFARAPIAQATASGRPPAPLAARAMEWLREVGAAVFHTDGMLRPAAVLTVCFISGLIVSYATTNSTNDILAEVSVPTLFTYFDLS